MAKQSASILPAPSPEHRRVATGQFEHANQVIASAKDYDYAIRLLQSCCSLDPANLIYRQALRRTQKLKHKNNKRGSWHAWLTTIPAKARLKRSKQNRDWLPVLELGERALNRNPWNAGTQLDMAEAADHLGLLDLAVWLLMQARQTSPNNHKVNRFLARLYEQRGNFKEATKLWELVRKANPTDLEAAGKAKDLAVHETIARGHYDEAIGGGSLSDSQSGDGPPSAVWRKPQATRSGQDSAERSSAQTAHESPSSSAARSTGTQERLIALIEEEPSNPNHYVQLVNLYRRTNKIDEARELLQRALPATANNFEIGSILADLEIEPFRQNLAITEERLATNQNDDELRKIRIRLMKEINSRELELFRGKADRYPTDMSYRFELGVRLLRAGQTEEAIRELQSSRSDARVVWGSSLYLGHAFKARRNWRLAKRNYEEALKHVPGGENEARKEILFHLAQGCAENGELSAAVDWAHELANLDFAYRNIGGLLDEWQTRIERASS